MLASVFLAAAIAFVEINSLAAAPGSPQQLTHEVAAPPTSSPLHIALSPNGRQLVAVGLWPKGVALYLIPADTEPGQAAQIIANSESMRGTYTGFPFWSPDSQAIAFFSSGKLKTIRISSGDTETLCSARQGRGGTWSPNGVIVFAPDGTGPLYQIPATGGIPAPVTQLDESRGEVAHRHPWFLPDGVHFLYLAVSTQPANSSIWVGSIYSPERTFVVKADYKAAFAPPNFLLYVQGSTLMARPFDPQSLKLSGDPFAVVRPVGVNAINNAAGFTTSDSGTLAYRRSGRAAITIVTDWTTPPASDQQPAGAALAAKP